MYRILTMSSNSLFKFELNSHLDLDLHSIESVHSPSELLLRLDSTIPDCILASYELSEADKFSWCQTMKDHALFCFVPILHVSQRFDELVHLQALSMGSYDCLTSDANPELVRLKIKAMIQLKLDYDELIKLRRFSHVKDVISKFSHDFNNPLTIALGNLNLLQHKVTDENHIIRLTRLSGALERMSDMIRSMRELRESVEKNSMDTKTA